jgi:hypothetical protein
MEPINTQSKTYYPYGGNKNLNKAQSAESNELGLINSNNNSIQTIKEDFRAHGLIVQMLDHKHLKGDSLFQYWDKQHEEYQSLLEKESVGSDYATKKFNGERKDNIKTNLSTSHICQNRDVVVFTKARGASNWGGGIQWQRRNNFGPWSIYIRL